MKKLAQWGEWFFRRCLNNVREKGIQLVLSGKPGCGKTHVAERVYGQIKAWSVDASMQPGWGGKFPWSVFLDWADIADADKQSAYEESIYGVKNARVVFIDDVGSESDQFKSGGPAARLRHLLSLCDDKWLMITTNLPKNEFFERYDARVADRLSAAHWCDCSDIPSYRPKLKKLTNEPH